MLVQSFDALDRESKRSLLKEVPENTLYDAALTIMMRLVFLFSAEERGLLHLGKPLYDDNYAVSTLQEQLQEVADRYGEEVLERRYDAWSRLLATFRAVHGGIQHQDLLMQAYGGSLFHPDRYPFLEGRVSGSAWRNTPATPLAVNNRVVLHLLNSLQRLRTKVGSGGAVETRRISFRALGVEQIGHVYEGLLDHTAVRASEPVLGIKGTRNKEPEIPLSRLESMLAQGREKLIEFLKDETGRSVTSLRRALEEGRLPDEHKLRIASGQDEKLLARLHPFAGLIREDSFDRPLVVLAGSIYVTTGNTRRSTGTHYTPPSLTEPIVQHTLEPLVYEGPAEGWPPEQWKLRSPKAILDLKVCDMAMGSGAFLLQACRYLAERLVEAWENEEKLHPGEVLSTPDGKFSEGSPSERLLPADANERIAIARRVVADRCLYGVDINPMAVEMAKLSLWLITVDRHRPFTFLDHAFKCGDSLLGITSLQQLEKFSLRHGGGKQMAFSALDLWRHIEEAKKKREALEEVPSDTPDQIAAKAALYAEAEEAVAKLNAVADVLVAVELKGLKGRAYEAERAASVEHMMAYWVKGLAELQGYARQSLSVRTCLHWALAFPEITGRGGFNAFIGNPPFLWGMRISTTFGEDYFNFLQLLANRRTGTADLCAFFFVRGFANMRGGAMMGLIAPDTIGSGDTMGAALDPICQSGGSIVRANTSFPWPGNASVIVSVVHLTKNNAYQGARVVNGDIVVSISSSLHPGTAFNPDKLRVNSETAFIGHYPMGMGFLLTHEQAQTLIAEDQRTREVIRSYLTGEDVNSSPEQMPSRAVIFFASMSEDEAKLFPSCYRIVREGVLPERLNAKRKANKERWWQFAEVRPGLNEQLRNKSTVYVQPFVSKYIAPVEVNATFIFASPMVVFPNNGDCLFPVLQSSIHDVFVRRIATNLGGTLRYAPSDCIEKFPFPALDSGVLDIGASYRGVRRDIMVARSEGITAIYNRFHNFSENSDDITELRRLHVEMDKAVAGAYGWQDIDLGHGFHETKQGIRYTISEAARREVLDRLLSLNHQRYAEEQAKLATQAATAPAKRGRKKKGAGNQMTIFNHDTGKTRMTMLSGDLPIDD